MRNSKVYLLVLFGLAMFAACGPAVTPTPEIRVTGTTVAPTIPSTQATPPLPSPYPPPAPESSATPAATPIPTAVPVPVLEVQPIPEKLRQGERIAFLRDGDLWLVRPDGSAMAQVSTSSSVSAIYGWSWDNGLLLFGVTSYETGWQCGYPGLVDLWVLPMDGSSPRQITQGQTVMFASWSPVDLSIAYNAQDALYVLNMEKGKTLRLEAVGTGIEGAAWSPDGTKLALVLAPPDQEPGGWLFSTDIGVWNLADGTVTNLTSTNDDLPPIRNSYPIWSLDGSRILFESDRQVATPTGAGRQRWYVIDGDGNDLRRLDTPPFLSALNTTRSPAADQVVMNLGGEVWLLDFGGNMKKIADTPWPCWAPYTWSPDGTKLALVEKEGQFIQVDLGSLAVETIVESASSPAWTH